MGAGSQGLVVVDILQRMADTRGDVMPVGLVDDAPERHGTSVLGVPVLGAIGEVRRFPHDAVIVAVGDNQIRRALTEQLVAAGERVATAVHPRASVAPSVSIGDGSMLCAGAIVSPNAVIGRGVILNTNASVDHDSVVEDFVHISPGATVGGRVHVGAEALIALGASVVSGVTIGARTLIGAGAVVVEPMPAGVVAFGVPARIRPGRGPKD